MRKIITTTFITLDGVAQSPGGPQEDPTNGFSWGGWFTNYWDEVMSNTMNNYVSKPFNLLLGRKTYEIFAAHWPFVSGDPVSDTFNKAEKYVVSKKPLELTWQHSHLITGDAVKEITELKKQAGNDLWIHGSLNLVQTLLASNLIDVMHLWICPLTIGKGKRIFDKGTIPQGLKLVAHTISSTGVMIATYEPVGQIQPGSFALETPTEAERKRRLKILKED